MAEWRDTSSWARSDSPEKRATPKSWTIGDQHGSKINVHRYVGCEGWFVTCHDAGVSCMTLTASGIEVAKEEALMRVRNIARDRFEAILKNCEPPA